MPDSIVVQRMNAYRAALLRQEAAQLRDMAARWTTVERNLAQSITDVLAEIARREAAGEDFGRTFGPYVRLERYQTLLRQVRSELNRYGAYTTDQVQQGIAAHVGLGVAHGAAAIEALAGEAPGLLAQFNRLSVPAIENMAAALQADAPVGQLLAEAWPAATVQMTEALINGVALGWNPRKTARAMREGLRGALQRSLRIARTEQLRAYRTATLETYRQSGVVVGYKRLAAKSRRTCIACLMADGTFYPLEQSFEEHVNGRCTLVPVVKGRPAPEWETGRTWFERQPADVQRDILGPAAFEAWQANAIRLEDLVERHEHPVWGGSLQVKSLRNALGAEEARRYVSQVLVTAQKEAANKPKTSSRYRELKNLRMDEVRAMPAANWQRLQTAFAQGQTLPKLNEHFKKHGGKFADLGITTPEALNALFANHVQRSDLRIFTYISTQAIQYRHWVLVGMDNGVMVVYNESQRKFWTIFRDKGIANFLEQQSRWWIEVSPVDGKPKKKRP